jgi:CRP-like cAMP-binding protein
MNDYSAELARFAMFRDLHPDVLRRISLSVHKPPPIRKGTTLFTQDSPVDRLFFILSGEVELRREEPGAQPLVRKVRAGQVLGRMELDAPEGQLGTARTTQVTEVLAIDREVLVRLRNTYPSLANQLDRSEVIGNLRTTPYFAPLTDLEIRWLSDIVEIYREPANTVLYRFGEPADRIFVLRQGRVRLESQQRGRTYWVSAGTVFGDRSVINQTPRSARAVTETSCYFYVIPAEDMRTLARRHLQDWWQKDPIEVEEVLHHAPLFQHLAADKIARLAGYTMQVHYNQPYRPIVRQGFQDEYYYILVRGRALREQEGNEAIPSPSPQTLEPGAAFGEASLLLGALAEATVITLEPTDWLRIHRRDFALFLAAYPDVFDRLSINDDLRRRYQGLRRIFSWQEKDEIVLLKRRRHWIVLLRNVFGLMLAFLVLAVLTAILQWVFPDPREWILFLGATILLSMAALWIIVDYLNDYYVVTSRRVVHQEKVILLREQRTTAPLDKIQDLNFAQHVWGKLFDYGDLIIRTAATKGQIRFGFVPHPQSVERLVREEMQKAKAGARSENQDVIRRHLQDTLHLGLEERIEKRALPDTTTFPSSPPSPSWQRRWQRWLSGGLREEQGHRLVWRKHWLGLLASVFLPLVFLLFSIVLFVFSVTLSLDIILPINFVLLIISLFFIGVSIFWLWWNWTDWSNDTYVVTDDIIEHTEKKPLFFDERRDTTSMEKVQNVDFRRPNLLAFLFDFGDVIIQTAAQDGEIRFRFVPQPERVANEILSRMSAWYERQLEARQRQSHNQMAEWLIAYHQLLTEEMGASRRDRR